MNMDPVGNYRCVNTMIFCFVVVTSLSVMIPSVTPTAPDVKNIVCDKESENCNPSCRMGLVESIPENLTFPAGSPQHPSTYAAWCRLLDLASQSIDIAAFYFHLRGVDGHPDPSDWQGEDIFNQIYDAGKSGNLNIRIARNQLNKAENETADIPQLEKFIEVRNLNFSRWFGSGILHTKLWLVDKKHFYVGSANMDWRSLTQVKELGVVGYDCPDLAADLAKIFEVYWYMGKPGRELPDKPWPHEYDTKFNKDHPLLTHFNDTSAEVYFSSSPPRFCPAGRTGDIDAILDVMNKAKKFIHIAVMDYTPAIIFAGRGKFAFWPKIDDELRRVALDKKVEVCLLVSLWNHTSPDMFHYLKSLAVLDGVNYHTATIKVKFFIVPSYTEAQRKIPYARVNHNKYMVTDNTAYIGTSNWSGDYFTSTGGVGIIVNQTAESIDQSKETVQQQLEAIFQRDWTSSHAFPVLEVDDDIIAKLQNPRSH